MIIIYFLSIMDMSKNKVELDVIPKINEEYISVTYVCILFIDSYRFLSSGLDSLVKTLVGNDQKSLKTFKKESVWYDNILNFVKEMEILLSKDGYKI